MDRNGPKSASCQPGALSKKSLNYRFLAIRELLQQKEFPGMEAQLPFATMNWGKKKYKLVWTGKESGPS
jgi:hypothetical protein